jgi:hypothetical protein
MANLIIKPSSSGDLKLQDEGGDDAITISTTGNTTLAGTANNLGTVTAGTLGSAVLFPTTAIASYTGSVDSASTASGSGMVRQVQCQTIVSHTTIVNVTSFTSSASGTGDAVCISVLAGSDVLVTVSSMWYITTGNVAYFTLFKQTDTGSGFGSEAQVTGLANTTMGITGGLQHAGGLTNYDGHNEVLSFQYLDENPGAGRHQYELHIRGDSGSATIGIGARGEGTTEIGTGQITAMELT